MYKVDRQDQVVELKNVPQSSPGAPIPIVLAGEHDVLLAYYLQNIPETWDATSVRMVGPDTEDEPVAIIRFDHCYVHIFGPPNDEAMAGHPLYPRGLKPYGAFEVLGSSWLRMLEKINSVHPRHVKSWFMENKRHFIFTFHDTTFECIAEGFTIEVRFGSVKSMVPFMLAAIR